MDTKHLTKMQILAKNYMNDIENGRGYDPQHAFELLMEAMLGEDIFDTINDLQDKFGY